MAMLKVSYLNVFENHLFPLTTLLNEHNQSLEVFQTRVGSVGSWCWEAAICLAEFCYDHMFNQFKNKRLVEIGSGTGVVGLQLCALGADVILTDRAEYVDLMQYNIDKNRDVLTGHAQATTLFWGDDEFDHNDARFQQLDFVIVANCVYHSIDLDLLIQTICSLCPVESHTRVLCCYELRNDGIRRLVDEFHERLVARNFSIEHIDPVQFREKYQQNDYNSIVRCQRQS